MVTTDKNVKITVLFNKTCFKNMEDDTIYKMSFNQEIIIKIITIASLANKCPQMY